MAFLLASRDTVADTGPSVMRARDRRYGVTGECPAAVLRGAHDPAARPTTGYNDGVFAPGVAAVSHTLSRRQAVALGLIVLAALGLGGYGVARIADKQGFWAETVELTAGFPEAHDVTPGTPVR